MSTFPVLFFSFACTFGCPPDINRGVTENLGRVINVSAYSEGLGFKFYSGNRLSQQRLTWLFLVSSGRFRYFYLKLGSRGRFKYLSNSLFTDRHITRGCGSAPKKPLLHFSVYIGVF